MNNIDTKSHLHFHALKEHLLKGGQISCTQQNISYDVKK